MFVRAICRWSERLRSDLQLWRWSSRLMEYKQQTLSHLPCFLVRSEANHDSPPVEELDRQGLYMNYAFYPTGTSQRLSKTELTTTLLKRKSLGKGILLRAFMLLPQFSLNAFCGETKDSRLLPNRLIPRALLAVHQFLFVGRPCTRQ